SGSQIAQASAQRYVQTVSQKRNENVRFDPVLQLMVNRPQGQVVFEILEGGLHFGELDVRLPQVFGAAATGDIAAHQTTACTFAPLPQFVFAQAEGKLGRVCRHSA